ncbi:ATP-binding protein [Streptomyces sp. NPDC049887]|uniref:ATP-binding protein n=1 Tax=Streptomyces sp. NPDC049887 TaxID=3155654 RepID=UPI003439B72D
MTVVELFKEPQAPARSSSWRRAGRRVRVVVTHDRTRTAGRLAVRHGSFVVGGTKVVAKRAWDGRSAARYERMMRAAEAAGNMDLAKEWEERGRAFRGARHQRRMDLLMAPQKAAKGALVGAAAGTGGLLALGGVMAVHSGELADVAVPLMTTIELVHWLVVIAGIVWGPAVALAPWLFLAAVWAVGRRQQTAPQWALPARERDHGGPIIPSIVVVALRDLGVAPLKNAIKDMGETAAQLLGPITLAGCGVEVDVTLPIGVSTEEVMSRRRKLAENLNRHEHEVYISVAPAARTVRLWIADSGALDEPIGPSPLVLDETLTADYKNGRAPWGVDLRGDAAMLTLYQKHVLVTGLSNQGKTASLRALALWLALDPTVEFRLADLKGVGDWRMFFGLATVLIEGPTDEHVIAATEMVEGAFEEMQRRTLSGRKDWPPLVVIVDEAQVAYGCGAVGVDKRPYGGAKATSRYFRAVKAIHDQGRAVNVTIWEGTQDPTNENLPKRSREGNHIRAALVLGTEAQAKMALGENPVAAGAAPHKLRQGVDKGQLVVAGEGLEMAAGQVSVNVRTHYISDEQAVEIADRAKTLRAGVATVSRLEVAAPVDALADIAALLGNSPRLRTQEVLQKLAERNPGQYRDWTFSDLRDVLEAAGAAPYKSDGKMVVSRERVLEAIAERDDEQREAAGR